MNSIHERPLNKYVTSEYMSEKTFELSTHPTSEVYMQLDVAVYCVASA